MNPIEFVTPTMKSPIQKKQIQEVQHHPEESTYFWCVMNTCNPQLQKLGYQAIQHT